MLILMVVVGFVVMLLYMKKDDYDSVRCLVGMCVFVLGILLLFCASVIGASSWVDGTMCYDFDPDFTYEIYCQPYRVTDIQLEPGEQVIEMPFLSESKDWEIGAGVSRVGGIDTQHFFLKPEYSGLESSFIIITDKRVYHLMLKSFKDISMTQVKWEYSNTMPFALFRYQIPLHKLQSKFWLCCQF